MTETLFIRARDVALRWGMPPATKSGSSSNHTMFLQRVRAKHPRDQFPTALRLGGRTVFRMTDVEAFERNLPTRAA
jgi:hypothetical protein